MAALRANGAKVWQLSGKGVPDLLICYQNLTLLAEVKSAKGKLTDDQVTFHAEWEGDRIWLLRSVDDAIAMLNDVRNGIIQTP